MVLRYYLIKQEIQARQAMCLSEEPISRSARLILRPQFLVMLNRENKRCWSKTEWHDNQDGKRPSITVNLQSGQAKVASS